MSAEGDGSAAASQPLSRVRLSANKALDAGDEALVLESSSN